MSLIIKNKLVKEDIIDENGNKLGEIKFNPDDSSIMKALTEILENLNKSIKKIDEYKNIDIKKLDKSSSLKDFEEASDTIEKLRELFNIEYQTVENAISGLEKVFGKDTIDCFTGGTKDIETLVPLIEFITPYIEKNRKKKVEKYIKNNQDVME